RQVVGSTPTSGSRAPVLNHHPTSGPPLGPSGAGPDVRRGVAVGKDRPMQIDIPSRFAGPPNMGHGGYVAGLFAQRTEGAVQVTLRRPTPLDQPLELLDEGEGRWSLRSGDEVIAESEPSTLEIEVPPPPSIEAARAAEAGSPSFYNDERGVHPTCFGCGNLREEGDGLRVFVGPVEVDGHRQVAGTWTPADRKSTRLNS